MWASQLRASVIGAVRSCDRAWMQDGSRPYDAQRVKLLYKTDPALGVVPLVNPSRIHATLFCNHGRIPSGLPDTCFSRSDVTSYSNATQAEMVSVDLL